MTTLHITRGLPASGKSTWAKAWVAQNPSRVRINRDDFRAMMFATPDYSHSQEAAVTLAARAAVKAILKSGRDVVADDTNLRPRYVREWMRFAKANGCEFEVTEFPISVEESITRDAARAKPVGAEVIQSMAQRYLRKGDLLPIPDEWWTEDDAEPETYTYTPGLPWAVIVDIDGTVALSNGRDPYDMTRVSDDLPNEPVIRAVEAAAENMEVIYCSGRTDDARADTETWLTSHELPQGRLLMRAAGDSRKDSIVKAELFNKHIRGVSNVAYVFDDRQQVVDMWRELGLTVLQVAPGDF